VALPVGKAEIISDGDEVAIFGLGALLPLARQLAAELKQRGFSAAVINPRFVKPLGPRLTLRLRPPASAPSSR